ncbi:MAG: hypothetical protein QOF01_1335 [Thermomicrobiales bacterium]|jgi:hypothetical protein|nr:hypothetical protein [Thermomicrobiales bacterium]
MTAVAIEFGKGMPVSLVVSLLLLSLMLVMPPGRVSAQSTPAAQEASPVAIPALDCTVAPRTVAALDEIVTEADLANATPIADPAPYTRPTGTPADAETVAAVTETVRQLVACVNAGDFMRFLALFSNDALRRYADDLDLPLEPDDDLLTPDPSTNEQVAFGGVEDVLVLADGRVSLLAHLPNQTNDSIEVDLVVQFILVRQGDRWLIDELIPIDTAPAAWTQVSGNGYVGVIVDAETAPGLARWLTGQEVTAGWEPTPDDVAALEAALPAFLATAPQASAELRQRLPEYKRQYAGIIDSDGRPVILVNAFCDAAGSDWHSEPVLVLDGGDCFFHVTYDPEGGTFSGLTINGDV